MTVHSTADGELKAVLNLPSAVRSLAYNSRELTLIAGDNHGRVHSLPLATDGRFGKESESWQLHKGPVSAVAVYPDGIWIASAGRDRVIRIRTSAGGDVTECVGHTDWVTELAFTSDGQYLVSAGADGTVRIWNPSTGGLEYTVNAHSGTVNALCLTDSPRYIVTGGDSSDPAIRFWKWPNDLE